MPSARLERSTTNKVIAGVCGGIAEYLAVDPTLVRVVFIVAAFLTAGLGLIAYIALVVLMPLPGRPAPFVSSGATSGAVAESSVASPSEASATSAVAPDPAARGAETDRRRMVFGYVLIGLGVALFLGNAGVFRLVQWQLVWPLVLVGIGVLLLVQRMRP